ncbi:MAG: hypothetical protein ACTIDH_05825 [Lactobacillus sp.]
MNLSLAELEHNLNDWLAINGNDSKLVFSKSMISRWENGKTDPQLSYANVVDKYFMELEMGSRLEAKKAETAREHYLQTFKRNNQPNELFNADVAEYGKQIVELLKKEDLTHDQAYASLQYAYNLIQYQANFLKLS